MNNLERLFEFDSAIFSDDVNLPENKKNKFMVRFYRDSENWNIQIFIRKSKGGMFKIYTQPFEGINIPRSFETDWEEVFRRRSRNFVHQVKRDFMKLVKVELARLK